MRAWRTKQARGTNADDGLLAFAARLTSVGAWEFNATNGEMVWTEHMHRLLHVGAAFKPSLTKALRLFPRQARREFIIVVREATGAARAWSMELPIHMSRGTVWIRIVGQAYFEDGKLTRLSGACIDITERKVVQDRLDESERFAKLATDSIPTRIAYMGRDLRFRFANAAYCIRFGRARSDVIGHTRQELTGKPYEARTRAVIEAALRGASQRFETWEDVGDGNPRLVEFQLVPDVASDGQVRGFFSAGTDITDRAATERALRDLTALLENTPDFVMQSDVDGRLTYINPAARRFLGLRPDEAIANRACSAVVRARGLFSEEIAAAVDSSGVWMGESQVAGADGAEIPVSHMIIGHRAPDGAVARYSAVMRDISQAVEGRRALLAQTSALQAVVEAIPAVIAVVGEDLRLLLVNTAYERWTGVDRDRAVGGPLDASLTALQSDCGKPWVPLALAGDSGSFGGAARPRMRERHIAGIHSPLRDAAGVVTGFIVVAQDVTERKLAEVNLLRLARVDPLTGLLNRAGFDAEADRLIKEGRAGAGAMALLCIDLDRFKPVNDTHGHLCGDEVLRTFADRVKRLIRPTDAVARLGGDEFAILLTAITAPYGAALVAEKVVAAAAEPFVCGGVRLSVGASVGVAFKADGEGGWESLLARADAMLYEAKNAGRGRYACQPWE